MGRPIGVDSRRVSRLRRAWYLGSATVVGSLPNLGLQASAILSLSLTEYGKFSILYLAYAWLVSLSFSIVGEPWLRQKRVARSDNVNWSQFGWITVWISLVGSCVAFTLGLLINSVIFGLLSGASVGLAVYRLNARFYRLASSHSKVVIWGDLVSGVVLFAYIFWPFGGTAGLLATWCIANALALVLTPPPGFDSFESPVKWVRRNRKSVKMLVSDSLLMDVSNIGTPALLAPMMGVASFGVYRAVGNVALPVRLVINAVRPKIGSLAIGRIARWSTIVAVGVFSAALSSSVVLALALLQVHPRVENGVLGMLGQYLVPVGLFIAGSFVETLFQLFVRIHGSQGRVFALRVAYITLLSGGPLAGWFVSGLSGAIWGLSLAICVQSVLAVCVVRSIASDGKEGLHAQV